jgi:FkbM family methyltransferase
MFELKRVYWFVLTLIIFFTIIEFLIWGNLITRPFLVAIPLILINFFIVLGIHKFIAHLNLLLKSRRINRDPSLILHKALSEAPFKDTISIENTQYAQDGQSEGLVINANGLKLFSKSLIDVQIAYNIAIRKVYNFLITSPTIVIDIGANVGYSALWFAQNKNVIKVFAFEPVRPTYNQALLSVDLNPELKNKIEFRNVGLYGTELTTSIAYNKNHHTISSVLFTKEYLKSSGKNKEEYISIELLSACETINSIIDFQKKMQCSLILKVDCEGSEYSILNSFTSKIWSSVDVILMEVHGENFQELQKVLLTQGYSLFSINHQHNAVFDHLCDILAIKNSVHSS